MTPELPPKRPAMERLWRTIARVWEEDRRLLIGAVAFAIASLIVGRLVAVFGIDR